MMKKEFDYKTILTYALSAFIPITIFLICIIINGYVPFGSKIINPYDAFEQYSGMLLEYARMLKSHHLFYSWGAGLGFNYLGSITYYGLSPLNLLSVFANSTNYHVFAAIMILLRFGLLGSSMCFYLSHKRYRRLNVVLFSSIYALMGFTATYYYNYLWIDSIIMLPLVIHGLDKLIEKDKSLLYIVSLTFTILINYYIGYMICIFSLLWFIYRNRRVETIKTFFVSSILSGLMSAVVIIPSAFALLTGKAEIYASTNYLGLENYGVILYNLSTGTYLAGDHMGLGSPIIYSSILVVILCIFYFFKKDASRGEKLLTGGIILFYYLSFTVSALNYAWQMFQRPIWWQSRFSFTFSFFLITIAAKVFENLESCDFKLKSRFLITGVFILGIIVEDIVLYKGIENAFSCTAFYLLLSIITILICTFFVDKRSLTWLIVLMTLIDVSMNTFNSVLNNYYKNYSEYGFRIEDVSKRLESLKKSDDSVYRMEIAENITANDGLYFGYNGIDYFNSARNAKVIDLLESLGASVYADCYVYLNTFDPVFMSLFNIKYLYANDTDYFDINEDGFYENLYPLALGFASKGDLSKLKLDEKDSFLNKEKLVKILSGMEEDLYVKVPIESFESDKDEYSYTFKSDGHYLVMPIEDSKIIINKEEKSFNYFYYEIESKDEVTVIYASDEFKKTGENALYLLDIDAYMIHMEALSSTLLNANLNEDGHIMNADITMEEDGYLFTSIEYEDGMRVYIDGEKREVNKLSDTLITFELSRGEHTIEIDYVPRGLKSGSIISASAIIITITYLLYKKRFKK